MDSTVVRAETADVIAFAFYQLGYRPRESLVLLGLHSPRLRLGLTIRSDLPPVSRQHDVPIEGHLRALRAHGDDAVFVLIVSDAPPDRVGRGPARPAYHRLARDLRRRLEAAGWPVQDVLKVGRSSWRSYLCRDLGCCPLQGRPVSEVTNSALAAWMVAHGHVLAPDEESLLTYVEPERPGAVGPGVVGPGVVGPGVVGSGVAAPGGPSSGQVPGGPPSPAASLARWLTLLQQDDGGRAAPGPDVAWLPDALLDRRFRDAVLVSLVPRSGDGPDLDPADADQDTLDRLFDTPPDEELLARGTSLLAAVARTAPPGRRADALAVLAWAAWWSGDGARGRLLAARAMADEPAHTLAALVDQLLFVGVPPGWARPASG